MFILLSFFYSKIRFISTKWVRITGSVIRVFDIYMIDAPFRVTIQFYVSQTETHFWLLIEYIYG